MIVDGVKLKDKRKKKELDDERIGQMRELEDDIKAVKRINEIFKKEIEALKGLSKPCGRKKYVMTRVTTFFYFRKSGIFPDFLK
jgi:hypothetical protein